MALLPPQRASPSHASLVSQLADRLGQVNSFARTAIQCVEFGSGAGQRHLFMHRQPRRQCVSSEDVERRV